MKKSSFEFLKNLIDKPSPSGFEAEAVEVWKSEVEKYADVSVDIHGNCIAVLQKGDQPKIMLAGHIDEIGFMVKYIDDKGFIYFVTVGGVDTQIIPGQRVKIVTKKGNLRGVIGRKPIHKMTAEERKAPVKIEDLWVDIGSGSKEETESMVDIGDVLVFDVGLEKLQSDILVGRGLDDKAGAFVIAQVIKGLSEDTFNASLYGVATVQEEIGLRGAGTSAYGISPDIGIAIDVAFATDHPGMDKRTIGDMKLGAGPVIARGPNINHKVFDLLIKSAKKTKIPYQVDGVPRGTGTDANAIQITKSGVATGLLSIPLRYMHTPVEVINSKDLEYTVILLKEFIKQAHKL
ncbi:MAG: M42 family metallopeptidase [Elusimicrobia bacterium]|nr:M42 family metallopeptidase [Elusimicrobiota bacterium]